MSDRFGHLAQLADNEHADEPIDLTRKRADEILAGLLTTEQLADIPKPKPLIDGLLYLDSLAMIYGASGAGKSFVAIDLAMHVASTRQWWHGSAVSNDRALYIVAEGAPGISLRTNAWQAHYEIRATVQWQPKAINLFDPVWAQALALVASELRPALIVIDTLARSSGSARENATEDMNLIVEHLDAIRLASGACVLLVHHSGKDASAGARGSSALRAAMDTEIELSGSTAAIRLKNTKQKNAQENEPISLVLKPVEGTGSGVIVATSAVDDDALPPGVMETLEALTLIEVAGGVSATAWRVAVDVAERTFYRHRSALLKHGLVSNVGTDKTPRYQVVCDA